MPEYRLSNEAKEDLINIAQYGDDNFGVKQSNQYRDQLAQRLKILAEQPALYPAVDHIRPGYRRSVCGSHSIYYRVGPNIIEITRILGRQSTDTAF